MNTLNDEDLTRLLDEVASSYDVPEHGPDEVLAALADVPPAVPLVRRRWVQLSAAAAVVTAGALFAATQYGNDASTQPALKAQPSGEGFRGPVDETRGGDSPNLVGQVDSYTSAGSVAATGGTASGGTTGGTTGGAAAPVPVAAPLRASLPQKLAAAPAAGSVGAAPPVTAAVGAPVSDDGESRVVKSGSIALVVKDRRVSPTLTAVQQAAAAQGGYITTSSSDEYGETPSGEVTVRVPVAKFEVLVAKIRALDAKVRTASTTGKDVTAQYSDMESQLRTLKATRERFLLILSKANTISEILTVQQRVDNVSGQIDKIEGQRKLLANQSELSTLTVTVSEEGDPVVKATTKPQSGISQAFENAKDGFVTGIESIISHSGRALLWIVCLGALLLFARSGWRVARRRLV